MSALLEANLRPIAARWPSIAAAVRAAAPDRSLAFLASTAGPPVPVRSDGRALHSKVDPVREARRVAAALPPCGVAVFLGLGGGYLPAAALARGSLFAAIVVERDAAALRALIEGADLTALLADPRVSLVVGAGDVAPAVLAAWSPGLMGDLAVVPLRPWCDAAPEFFARAAASVEAARSPAAADLAAQARFGGRWMVNALANLPAIERARLAIPPVERAIVTGAGPSLDLAAADLAAARGAAPDRATARPGVLLVATDTSLPALAARGIAPDLAVSIDCQAWGYHHVLPQRPAAPPPMLLDVSSPPALVRCTREAGFFASGHPFARWLSRHWRSLPEVDTGGGNVTHAAVSAVYGLGARELRLAGVDFSCPLGSPYARDTWLHRYHRLRADRTGPLEGALYGMLVAAAGTTRDDLPEGPRYTSPLMKGYRRAFERLAGSLDAAIDDAWCRGPPLEVQRHPAGAPARWADGFRMGAPRGGWRSLIDAYGERLEALAAPSGQLASWWHGLDDGRRETWTTLLPLVPALARATPDLPADRAVLLERARSWTLARLSALASPGDRGVSHE